MEKDIPILQNNPGQYILQPMIFILSAPVQTGKTTSVIKWSEGAEVHGILTPVVNGKRLFMNAATKEQFPMEASGNEAALSVGRFTFSMKGFEKAIQVIRNSINKKGWLIIDEIGPLELRGEGFHDVLKEVLTQREGKTLLIVRKELVGQVNRYYDLSPIVVGDINDLGNGKPVVEKKPKLRITLWILLILGAIYFGVDIIHKIKFAKEAIMPEEKKEDRIVKELKAHAHELDSIRKNRARIRRIEDSLKKQDSINKLKKTE